MKNIVVPVDFSTNSHQAYLYAVEFGKALNAEIKVIHYFLPKRNTSIDFPQNNLDEILAKKKKELDIFIKKSQATTSLEGTVATTLRIDCEVKPGFAEKALIELSKSQECDLIIMGTTGNNGLLKKIFGSVSTAVAKNADCPVLLVPPKTVFSNIKNIVFASSYEAIQKETLTTAKAMADQLGATINLVHIEENKKASDFQLEELILNKLIEKKVPGLNLKVKTLKSKNTWTGLKKYIKTHKAELLIMVTHRRNSLEELLHKSQTKEAIVQLKNPILILHNAQLNA